MAKHCVVLIPEKPGYIPPAKSQTQAQAKVKELIPDAKKVGARVSKELRFEDAGDKFGRIWCSKCGEEVPYELWDVLMGEDQEDKGGKLKRHDLGCCGAKQDLHQLRYDVPVGWARFSLTISRAGKDEIRKADLTKLEKILGCDLRVIYRREGTV